MNVMKNHPEGSKLKIPFISMLLTTIIIFFMEFFALFNYGTAFDKRILIAVAFFALNWTIISVVALCTIAKDEKIWDKNSLFFVLLMAFAVCFILNSVWNQGYLSLNPVKAIVTGEMSGDSLCHAAFAGGVATYNHPTVMINDLSLIHYHVFSHILLGTISKIIDVPTIFVYCFVFPIIFIPLFLFVYLSVCVKAKEVFTGENCLNVGDIIIICCSIAGWLPTPVLKAFGEYKRSNFLSESYFVANTLVFIYLFVLLYGPKKRYAKCAMLLIINPLFIFLLFYSKSAVGLLFFGCIGYYLFRKHIKDVLYYFLYVYYVAVLLFAMYIANGRGASNFTVTPFHFVNTNSLGGVQAFDIYILVNFVSLFVLLIFRKIKCGYRFKEFVLSQDYVWEQLAIIVSFVSIVPGCCVAIVGGSAAYFYLALPFYFVVLIIAYDIPSYVFGLLKDNKIIIQFVGILLILTIIRNANVMDLLKKYNTDVCKRQNAENVDLFQRFSEPAINETLYSNIEKMYLISRGHRDEYATYIDESSEYLNLYCNERNYAGLYKEMCAYPGLTNMLCLSFVNSDGEYYYDCTGRVIADVGNDFLWNLNLPQYSEMKSFEEAVATAPDSIKYVFRVFDDCFEVVEVTRK